MAKIRASKRRLLFCLVGLAICVMVFLFNQRDHPTVVDRFTTDNGKRLNALARGICNPEAKSVLHRDGGTIKIPEYVHLYNMTELDLHELYHRYIVNSQFLCHHAERFGGLQDGGWDVCLDEPFWPRNDDCLVYSFGVSNNFSFDDDAALRGCTVYAFDPNLDTGGVHIMRGPRIHFYNLGLGGKDEVIAEGDQIWEFRTLKTLRREIGHALTENVRIDLVKIDIDGLEQSAVPKALEDGTLNDVRQLAFELHLGESMDKRENYIRNLLLLREVYKHGFRIYLTHRDSRPSHVFIDPENCKSRSTRHEVHMVNSRLFYD